MAFLSHSIPWTSLAQLFEHRTAKVQPRLGPNGPAVRPSNLIAKEEKDHSKELEHFAVKFQETVREHAAIERRKYRSSENYTIRSSTWTTSQEEIPADTVDAQPSDSTATDPPLETKEERKRRSKQSHQPSLHLIKEWFTPIETRKVYPLDFSTIYLSFVPITSGHAYGREGLVHEFTDIETWIDCRARQQQRSTFSEDERNRLWLDEKSASDILRLLIIDAATTQDDRRRAHTLDTLLLLTRHPQVGLRPFMHSGMDCCNVDVGVQALIEKVLIAFIHLNLLWTILDSDSRSAATLRKSCSEADQRHADSTLHFRRRPNFVSLCPRPVYLDTSPYNLMMNTVLNEHGHMVEHVFFIELLAPYASGKRSRHQQNASVPSAAAATTASEPDTMYERDPFADKATLKEALKSMWKMLVYCEMLFRDDGTLINWEYAVLESLASVYMGAEGIRRLLGESWMDYELRRHLDEGGFRYYLP